MSDKPKRIQRKRTKGWKMPAGAIYVGRPTKWGNPFKVSLNCDRRRAVHLYRWWLDGATIEGADIYPKPPTRDDINRELRGHDLACWCKPGESCHADVLLRIANE